MLARLFGKSDIYSFKVEIFGDVKTFDFLKIEHHESGDVLTQVINITRDGEKLIGDCKIIGFKDQGVLRNIRTPFTNDANVEIADDKFIEKTIGLNTNNEAFMGILEHHPDLKINLDLKKTITKHIGILAKSGAGKSYTVGVILEEVMKKNIPIVILDPHNEYASLKYPNGDKKDLKRLEKFNLKPQGFLDRVKEYSPDTSINPQCEPITLDVNKLKPQDLIESLPQKLTPGQQSLIFNILSNSNNRINFDELIFNVSNEESTSKWSLISLLEQVKKLKLFSNEPTPLNEIVKYKRTSIITLKGVEPYVQETLVSGLLRDLFEARKKEEIPPFLLVLEEAHNFCPERSLGETKSSKIIRTIAAEGRKFGLGLCVVSQRPAKVDKNVISQCGTQILLKMTNPNDIKTVIASSEGVSSESENEIQKLNIGTCLLTGVIDIPLKLNVRPRISKHGGETVDITLPYEVDSSMNDEESLNTPSYNGDFEEDKNEFDEQKEQINFNTDKEDIEKPSNENSEFIQHVAPELEIEDAKVMLDTDSIETQLVPGYIIKMKSSEGKESNILFDRSEIKIIKTLFPFEGYNISPLLNGLTESEKKLLKLSLSLQETFNPAEILLKSDITYNEVLRVCDSLASKGILEKDSNNKFSTKKINFMKKIEELNFYGNQKFEEISYDKSSQAKIDEETTKQLFTLFGSVENIKEISILRYVGK